MLVSLKFIISSGFLTLGVFFLSLLMSKTSSSSSFSVFSYIFFIITFYSSSLSSLLCDFFLEDFSGITSILFGRPGSTSISFGFFLDALASLLDLILIVFFFLGD